jgi:hypothetical protein
MYQSRQLRSMAGVFLATALTIVTATPVVAVDYTQTAWNSSAARAQNRVCWCVVASAMTWLKHIDSGFYNNQSTLNAVITAHDKYDWTTPPAPYFQCSESINGQTVYSYAHDSRGWAWALWLNSGTGLGYNDYRFSVRAYANEEIVKGIRATDLPVGVHRRRRHTRHSRGRLQDCR